MRIYLENYERGQMTKEEEGRCQHEKGHRLVHFALEDTFGRTAGDVHLSYGPSGKPSISGHPEMQFNLTHTAGLVACVTGSGSVGIDAEKIRPFSKAVLRKMTEKERNYIQMSENLDEAFMRVWTMKEAYIKMTGEGLAAFGQIECIPGQTIQNAEYRQILWQGQYIITAMEKFDL